MCMFMCVPKLSARRGQYATGACVRTGKVDCPARSRASHGGFCDNPYTYTVYGCRDCRAQGSVTVTPTAGVRLAALRVAGCRTRLTPPGVVFPQSTFLTFAS